eukprot:TRINITY_DN12452_c0_g2_i1.p1 TRINITY_DN12452_c0_g2~~TRINITY_DN12452_c0_g2_i1.p1  ORF type:complete len:719 (-),score=100.77 TRINITY_DN12452_c0_g2_i1:58-2214(-)
MMLFLVAVVFAAPVNGDVTDCKADTWGLAGEGFETPFIKGSEELDFSKCSYEYKDFDQEDGAVVNWYPSQRDYEDFHGIDMVPSRHWEYSRHIDNDRPHYFSLENWTPGVNGPLAMREKIKLGECEIPQADGGAWHVQRVGPLVSTGNYDFWQFGWTDLWRMSRVLKKHSKGVHFTGTLVAGILNGTGEILGYPPIHSHHIHILPRPNNRLKLPSWENISLTAMAIEQHGDYQCNEADGGVKCLFEKPGKGLVKELHGAVDLEGEFNDARAPGAPPMAWWFTIAIRWHPKSAVPKRPVSQMFVIAMGKHNISNQFSILEPYPQNAHEPSVFWYTGTMAADGELVRNKLHTHALGFEKAFWFKASPEELGLLGSPYNFKITYRDYSSGAQEKFSVYGPEPILVKNTGLPSFQAIEQHLLTNLAAASERHSWKCGKKRSFLDSKNALCMSQKPSLVCSAIGATAEVFDDITGENYHYDRRPPTCCRPWKFHKGDAFTTVSFNKALSRAPGPWARKIPTEFPQHLHWLLTYVPSQPQADASVWSLGAYNQGLAGIDPPDAANIMQFIMPLMVMVFREYDEHEIHRLVDLTSFVLADIRKPKNFEQNALSHILAGGHGARAAKNDADAGELLGIDVSFMSQSTEVAEDPTSRNFFLGTRMLFPVLQIGGLLAGVLLAAARFWAGAPCGRRLKQVNACCTACARITRPHLPRLAMRFVQRRSD